ncbi:CapA family protein [Kineosporia sp. A_224]|uniref:CapA family protein n=1 Tax=Kineosporia sp. A_224 TaxID=1962180 RepID=UPI0018E93E18|nr:CapA family protein [Kineosporia sp. A_224]
MRHATALRRRPAPTVVRSAGAFLVTALVGSVLVLTGRDATALPVRDPKPVVLAFAGDVHFEGASEAALDGNLGTAAKVLKAADLAVVNLETAVTTRGTPEPKQYTFRAPPRAFAALRTAGVDAVSMANNHGMDYGRVGLRDSLAAAKDASFPVLGAGADSAAAFAPLRRTIRGVRVSVFAATDVLDSFATTTWPATTSRAGLATTKGTGLARLARAVRAEKADGVEVVVVLLHWGVERRTCPTARQADVARTLASAGADAVVGSHAHVLQPQTKVAGAVVHYGMGNFVFYARPGAGAQTGVLSLTVTARGVKSTAWDPAVIVSGRPKLLTGAARTTALAAQRTRGAGC